VSKATVLPIGGRRTDKARPEPVAPKLFGRMLHGYEEYGRGSKRRTPKTVADQIAVVKRLVEDTNCYPWDWSLSVWDEWNIGLVDQNQIRSSTQRKYQSAIRDFYDYLCRREAFVLEVRKEFGVELSPFLDDDDVLDHIFMRDEHDPRAFFTREQISRFFASIREKIEREATYPTVDGRPRRTLLVLQRDLAMFSVARITGLRAASILALNTWSFGPNPRVPEMGDFGALVTIGKGSRGSGPKTVTQPIDDLRFRGILEWYLTEVRPSFLRTTRPNEHALFLSERGGRLSYQMMWKRFHEHLLTAQLENMGLVIHSFRHSKATLCGEAGYDLETTRRILSHTYGSTTQGYMAVSDEFSQSQVDENLRRQIARAKAVATKKPNSED
jgi:site-specific recombinase XerD